MSMESFNSNKNNENNKSEKASESKLKEKLRKASLAVAAGVLTTLGVSLGSQKPDSSATPETGVKNIKSTEQVDQKDPMQIVEEKAAILYQQALQEKALREANQAESVSVDTNNQ